MKYVIADITKNIYKTNIIAKADTYINARKKCYTLVMKEKKKQMHHRRTFGIYEEKKGTYDLKGIVSYDLTYKSPLGYGWYVTYSTANPTAKFGNIYTYELYPDGKIKRIN